jgi:hypothetical protein
MHLVQDDVGDASEALRVLQPPQQHAY